MVNLGGGLGGASPPSPPCPITPWRDRGSSPAIPSAPTLLPLGFQNLSQASNRSSVSLSLAPTRRGVRRAVTCHISPIFLSFLQVVQAPKGVLRVGTCHQRSACARWGDYNILDEESVYPSCQRLDRPPPSNQIRSALFALKILHFLLQMYSISIPKLRDL